MKKSILNKLLFTIASFAITTIAFVPRANAETLVITGNGEGSSSEVNISSNSETNIQQSNTADITNDVNTTADTGNNTTNNNTGGSNNIATGDASSTTNITNNANTSVVDQECCVSPTPSTTITVSGNGADSNNNTSLKSIYQTTVTINQNASITNTILETANTGNNTANNNTGNVSIQTGNITSTKNINNDSINSVHINGLLEGADEGARLRRQGQGRMDSFQVDVSNNGTGSNNNITFEKNNNSKISITNYSDIQNNITSDLNTGNNHADGNTGDVAIRTGDIISSINILNDVNHDRVDLGCCKSKLLDPVDPPADPATDPIDPPQQKDLPPTPRPIDPPILSNNSSGPSDPPSQVGQVAAAVASILPATGNNILFFALLSNIAMFLLGAYLRLRSGNSPGFAFAI